jgi:Zn-dependent M28 family amino/carboxypeptidase
VLAQNLGVELPGADLGHEIVIVGAHYDSALGTPGADDNASGAAALLALARGFSGARPARTLRLVAFANAEAPHFRTPQMGSLVYAKRSAARGEKVVAMISIDSIGYYSDAPNSQRRADSTARYPSTGDFVAVEGNEASKALVDRVLGAFLNYASISAHGAALRPDSEGAGASDDWAFWQVGYPAVTVTDTASFRNPHRHRSEDTEEKLDFARMARVVAGLEGAIGELAQFGKKQLQATR